jgi:hypothetical protein|tara:strand:- start:901 stop:1032 length:132 start_codon:yes stop_codon:yes gene_type:complete
MTQQETNPQRIPLELDFSTEALERLEEIAKKDLEYRKEQNTAT